MIKLDRLYYDTALLRGVNSLFPYDAMPSWMGGRSLSGKERLSRWMTRSLYTKKPTDS